MYSASYKRNLKRTQSNVSLKAKKKSKQNVFQITVINNSLDENETEDLQGEVSSPLDMMINFQEQPKEVFEWLIAPLSPDKLFKTNWEKEPCYIKRNQHNYYQNLLTSEMLQSIFLDNILMYTRNVDVVSYTNDQRETHNVEGRAVPAALWDYYRNGCSIRILNPHTYCAKLHSLLAALQEYFGCMAGVNAYLTPPGSQGFAPHYDDIEAFVLQLEGRKHWRLYAPCTSAERLPRYSSNNLHRNDLLGKPRAELTLEAGDLLYFPRGTIHEGFTDDDAHSLHITVSVYQKTSYTDLLEHVLNNSLKAAASAEEGFRELLPRQFLKYAGDTNSEVSRAEKEKFKNSVKDLFKKMIEYIDVDSAADELGKQFMWDSMPPIPSKEEKDHMTIANCEEITDGDISNNVKMTLDVEVRLLRYHCLRLVKEDENNIHIYFNTDNAKYYHGNELQVIVTNNKFAEAVKRIIQAYPDFVKIKTLPLLKDEEKLKICRILWKRGLLVTKAPLSEQ